MDERLRVFVCTDHDYHYPVGSASVVTAEDEAAARKLLDAKLIERGLRPSWSKAYTLKELSLDEPSAEVLCDGNY